jgi:hypothetical protein
MIVASGSVIKKAIDPTSGFLVPISKVVYYDTPFGSPSWGMKQVIYDNILRDNVIRDSEAVFSGRDLNLSHSWGHHGHPIVGKPRFLAKWLGHFYAEEAGSYTFYATADDGVRFYFGGSNPESATQRIDEWELRSTAETFTYSTSLGAGSWTAFKLEYMAGESAGEDAFGDVALQYSVDGSRRRVVSAGVANFPDGNFIDSTETDHYLELPSVVAIEGNVGLGKVGAYSVKLPLDSSEYQKVEGTKSNYKHVNSNVVVKPGRLIDIWAGYHTKCRHYQGTTCALGIDHVPSGWFSNTLCESHNPKCPFQESLPGDLVKRFRGRITSINIERDREESYVVLECHDNTYYLQAAINENYPDFISYNLFDYNNQHWGFNSPDGIFKPNAYDGFLLGEAAEDLCIKAGVDASYLYRNQQLIKGSDEGDMYEAGPPLFGGYDVRLSKPDRYGNPLGVEQDIDVDDRYVWNQNFGEPVIDLVANLADNYGYLFYSDPDGNIVFRPRGNTTIHPASDFSIPGGWSRIADSRAFTGAYLSHGGGEASLTTQGSRFDIYLALGSPRVVSTQWSILYNEGLNVDGYSHGEYDPSDVVGPVTIDGNLLGLQWTEPLSVWYFLQYTGSPNDVVTLLEDKYMFPLPRTSYVFVNPQENVTFDEIHIDAESITKIDRSHLFTGISSVNYYVTVTIGQYSFTADSPYSHADSINMSSTTQIASAVNITNLFTQTPVAKTVKIPTSSYGLNSGTNYVVRFETIVRDADTLQAIDFVWLLQKISRLHGQFNPDYLNFFKSPDTIPWSAGCRVKGTRIDPGASPNPAHWSVMFEPKRGERNHPTHGIENYTWDPTDRDAMEVTLIGDFTSPLYYSNYDNAYTFPHISFAGGSSSTPGHFSLRIEDGSSTEVFNEDFAIDFEEITGELRFSSYGVDVRTGTNPSIVTVKAEDFIPPLGDLDVIKPSNQTHTIFIGGTGVSLEGVSAFAEDTHDARFVYTSLEHMFNYNAEGDTTDIRNDVIVVGKELGPVSDPDTGNIINPNNPQIDYVYSRSIDLGSIYSIDTENSMGMKIPFLLFEPNIQNQAHADYLSLSVLDRYRKLKVPISWDGVAAPHIGIDDSVIHDDVGDEVVDSSTLSWVEGYSERIESGKYEMTVDSTPLPPWPSFIPPTQIEGDVNDFQDEDGVPNLIVDVRMTDEAAASRSTGAGGTAYDPYESDGSSLTNHPGEELLLLVQFNLVVEAFVTAHVSIIDGTGAFSRASYIIGQEDSEGNPIAKKLDPGTHIATWGGIDHRGVTRVTTDETIVTEPAGIFGRDGLYIVTFEVNALDETHHTVDGAKRQYKTDKLSNSLNPEYVNYGQQVDGNFHRQYWELATGAVTQLQVQSNPNVIGPQGHDHWAVGGDTAFNNSRLTVFSSQDNNGEGINVYLTPETNHENRMVKFTLEIGIGGIFFMPNSEYGYDTSSGEFGIALTEQFGWSMCGLVGNRIDPDQDRSLDDNGGYVGVPGRDEVAMAAYDGVVDDPSAAGGDYRQRYFTGSNDEFYTSTKWCLIRNRGLDSKIVDTVDFKDQWKRLRADPGIYFNPTSPRWGEFKYDNLPEDYWSNPAEGNGIADYVGADFPHMRIQRTGGAIGISDGWLNFQLLFAAKWFTFWFKAWDKQVWDHSQNKGFISQADWDAFGHWQKPVQERINTISLRAHWIPSHASDVTGGFDDGPVSGWLQSPQSHTLLGSKDWGHRRIDIPSYAGLTDARGSSIDVHCIPCTHVDAPWRKYTNPFIFTFDWGAERQAFSDQIGRYTFYAWPIWRFWPNINDRTIDPIAAGASDPYFTGSPPLTDKE